MPISSGADIRISPSPFEQVSEAATRFCVEPASLRRPLWIVGGHDSAFPRRCDLLIHHCSERLLEIALAQLPSCLHPGVRENVTGAHRVWLINLARNVTAA